MGYIECLIFNRNHDEFVSTSAIILFHESVLLSNDIRTDHLERAIPVQDTSTCPVTSATQAKNSVYDR